MTLTTRAEATADCIFATDGATGATTAILNAPSPSAPGTLSAASSAVSTGTSSSRALGANLEAAGVVKPAGSAAHHIVAGGSPKAAAARAVLTRFGIGINDAANGVFLPGNLGSENVAGVAVHSTIHTNAYYSEVNLLLQQATTREEALEALAYVRSRLLSGGFP